MIFAARGSCKPTSSDESTTAENSDVDTPGPCSEESRMYEVCGMAASNGETKPSIVVRSTFLDINEGGLMQQYRKLRRTVSDSCLDGVRQEVYVPGEYSKKRVGQRAPTGAKTGSSLCATRATGGGTVMLRNLPNNYTRDMLLALLDQQGLGGRYDFVYLPCDFKRDANLGYAFVNLMDSEAVQSLWKTFDGFSGWCLPSSKTCQVKWSGPLQGFDAHVQRYRNSPVMHKSVPEKYKPVIFKHGQPVPFPEPNRKVKAPTM
eukprot:Skav207209  [mRNA]  locus=scaffold1244:90176:94594:+ [translate_table: standard]